LLFIPNNIAQKGVTMIRLRCLNRIWLALVILGAFGCATTPPSETPSTDETTLQRSKASFWKTHNSSLGFSIDLPPGYLVISKEELKQNPEILDDLYATVEKTLLKSANETFKEQFKAKLESGNIEIYRRSNSRVSITVRKEIGGSPQTHDELRRWCEEVALEYKNVGISVNLQKCELRKLGELPALYLVTEMPAYKAAVVQYAVQKSSAIQLFFSAGTKTQALETTENEFDQIMKSLKLR